MIESQKHALFLYKDMIDPESQPKGGSMASMYFLDYDSQILDYA